MSTRGRGRQPSLRTRLLSWAGTAAPQRGPSQRQPSQVTTTVATPQSPEAQDQPLPPPQPRQQLLLPGAQAPPPSRRSTQPPPSMGTAPSKPAAETRSPATGRAPPSPPPPPTDATPPRSEPTRRTPSRQPSRTYTQPPSPSGPLSQSQAAVPRGPSPSPPPPTVSPAQPAFPAEPKAPSTTPPQAPTAPPAASPTPPPAASTPPSPPAKAPPQPQLAPVLEIPAAPPMSPPPTTAPGSPATKAQELQPPPTEQKEQTKEEEEAPITPAKLQPQETSQEKDNDLALMPTELQKRPVPEAADKTISTESPTIPHPAPETRPDKTEDQLPPTKEVDHKQTSVTTEPPKPERIEEESPVLRPEGDQDSVPTLPEDIERKVVRAEGEKRSVDQPELVQEEDPSRSKTIETKAEEFKEETPKTSPVPTPHEQPQIKESQETTTMVETKQTTDEQPQAKDSQEATNMVGTKQTSQEPYQKPIQIHTQPIREVKLSEAEQPEKQPPPPEKEPAALPIVPKGKEGKIAISAVARTSTSSREQSGSLHKEMKEGISRLVQNLAVQHTKQTGGGQGISIITLAGDNQGASMYVGYSTTAREGGNVHVHKGPWPNGGGGGGGGGGTAATGEDGQKKTDQQSNMANPTSSTSVNSNVQTINNSILQDSCCSEEDPGVHLVISTKPPELAQQQELAKPAQPQKHRTRLPLLPLKGAHEPTVRRRCLRALFLEPSDDDAEKPRRHGCRFCRSDEKNAKGKQDGAAGERDA